MSKPLLSREKIVNDAIRLADEEGLAGVSLRRLAGRLGVHVTSLYNHVATKDALFGAMNLALMAEARLPSGKMSWQEWTRRFAEAMLQLGKRHPGAFELFQRSPAQGEQVMVSLESAITAFRADGFDVARTSAAIRTINVAVLGLVLDELGSDLKPGIRAELGKLSPDRFPNIHELLSANAGDESSGFVLDALISGIEANRNSKSVKSCR